MKQLKLNDFATHTLKFAVLMIAASFFFDVIYLWLKSNPFPQSLDNWLANVSRPSRITGNIAGSIFYGLCMTWTDARKRA